MQALSASELPPRVYFDPKNLFDMAMYHKRASPTQNKPTGSVATVATQLRPPSRKAPYDLNDEEDYEREAYSTQPQVSDKGMPANIQNEADMLEPEQREKGTSLVGKASQGGGDTARREPADPPAGEVAFLLLK